MMWDTSRMSSCLNLKILRNSEWGGCSGWSRSSSAKGQMPPHLLHTVEATSPATSQWEVVTPSVNHGGGNWSRAGAWIQQVGARVVNTSQELGHES